MASSAAAVALAAAAAVPAVKRGRPCKPIPYPAKITQPIVKRGRPRKTTHFHQPPPPPRVLQPDCHRPPPVLQPDPERNSVIQFVPPSSSSSESRRSPPRRNKVSVIQATSGHFLRTHKVLDVITLNDDDDERQQEKNNPVEYILLDFDDFEIPSTSNIEDTLNSLSLYEFSIDIPPFDSSLYEC